MADLPKVYYKGRWRPADDLISDIEWDISHGNRDSASDEISALQHTAVQTGDKFLQGAGMRLYAMLNIDLPPRSADEGRSAASPANLLTTSSPGQQPRYTGVDQPAASPANLPAPATHEIFIEQKLLYFRIAMLQVVKLTREGTGKLLFYNGSLWKAPFRLAVDIGLLAEGKNSYAEFDKIAQQLGFDDQKEFTFPFSKDYIKDITKDSYKRYLDLTCKWTTDGLKGKQLYFAESMIAVKDELQMRLTSMGAC